MNFFELFQLPVAFDIDGNALEQQLRQLQSRHHPDSQTDGEDKKHAGKMSAIINHAYQILKYPDSRASYLLELARQADNLQNSITDLDFLDTAMEFRTALDEADKAGLADLKPCLQAWLNDLSAQFNQSYQQQNWTHAIDFAQKLKFLVKIDKDLAKKVDELADFGNDDDLYV